MFGVKGSVPVNAEMTRFDAAIATGMAKIAKLSAQADKLKLDADDKALIAKIAGLEKQAAHLEKSLEKMTADVDIRAAETKIVAIDAEIRVLKSNAADIAMRANTTALNAQIAAENAKIDQLTKDRTLKIKIATDSSGIAGFLKSLPGRISGSGGGQSGGGGRFLGGILPGGARPTGAAIAGVSVLGLAAIASGFAGIIPVVAAAGLGISAFGALAAPTITSLQAGMTALTTATDAYATASSNLNTSIHQSPADMAAYQAVLKGLEPDLASAAVLLTNQNATWQTLTPSQRRSVVALRDNAAAYKTLLPSQKNALNALIKEGNAWNSLTPAQQAASQQISKLTAAFGNMATALEPLTLKVLNDGLTAANTLLPFLLPLATAAGKAIDGLLKSFEKFAASPGFKAFMDNMTKLSGPAITAIGTDLGKLVIALGKLLLAMESPDAIKVMNFLFNVMIGIINGLAWAFKTLTPIIAGVFDWAGKLPRSVTGPLLKAAGVAAGLVIVLNKLPGGKRVLSFAVSLVGKGLSALLSLFGIGGKTATVDVAAGAMQTAGDTMVTAAGAMQKAADTMAVASGTATGGGTAGGAGAAAAKGGKLGGIGALLTKGTILAIAAVVIADLLVKPALQGVPSGKIAGTNKQGNWWDNPGGANPTGTPAQQGVSTWKGLWTDTGGKMLAQFDNFRHRTAVIFDGMRHDVSTIWNTLWSNTAGRLQSALNTSDTLIAKFAHNIPHWFDVARHDISSIWDTVWNNTIGRLQRGVADSQKLVSGWEHNIAHWFDVARHDISSIWDTVWSNTVGRANRGIHDAERLIDTMRHDIAAKFDTIRHDIATIWDVVWNNTVGRATRGLHDVGNAIKGAWNWVVTNIWDPVKNFMISTVPGWFDTAVTNIGRFFGGLYDKVRGPVVRVIDSVLDGLITIFDDITNAVGLGTPLKNFMHPLGLAQGGMIPGWGGGDRVQAMLEPGEAVIDKFRTRKYAGVLGAMGVPGFAGGGAVPGSGGRGGALNPGGTNPSGPALGPFAGLFGKALDIAKIVADLATGNATAAANAFAALLGKGGSGGLGGNLGAAMAAMPGKLIADAVKWLIGQPATHPAAAGGGAYLGAGSANYAADIASVLKSMGLPLSLVGNWLSQIQTESGGNLAAVNLTDSNAAAGHPSVGLLQLIPGTFAAFAGPYRNTPPLVNFGGGTVSENAMAQIYAAIHYAASAYGGANMANVIGHGHGYHGGGLVFDSGGTLMPGWNPPMYNGTGRPETLAPTSGPQHGVRRPATLDDVVAALERNTAAVMAQAPQFGQALSSVSGSASRGSYSR